MAKARIASLTLPLALAAFLGCSEITAPRLVTSFNWGEVEDPETVVEGIDTSVALGELFILGQFNTPTRCYELDGDFSRKGRKLTLRVAATSSNSPNCDQSLGGFRYTASMSNLDFGTYDLTVVHNIAGGAGGQFTTEVELR